MGSVESGWLGVGVCSGSLSLVRFMGGCSLSSWPSKLMLPSMLVLKDCWSMSSLVRFWVSCWEPFCWSLCWPFWWLMRALLWWFWWVGASVPWPLFSTGWLVVWHLLWLARPLFLLHSLPQVLHFSIPGIILLIADATKVGIPIGRCSNVWVSSDENCEWAGAISGARIWARSKLCRGERWDRVDERNSMI